MTAELAEAIDQLSVHHRVFCFHGELGAGKTTIIKLICKYLGVTENMSSPTFAIVNTYESNNSQKIFHFDLYRLKSENELIDIGWYDYLISDSLIFVEWPENGGEQIPEDAVHFYIVENPQNHTRSITITYQP